LTRINADPDLKQRSWILTAFSNSFVILTNASCVDTVRNRITATTKISMSFDTYLPFGILYLLSLCRNVSVPVWFYPICMHGDNSSYCKSSSTRIDFCYLNHPFDYLTKILRILTICDQQIHIKFNCVTGNKKFSYSIGSFFKPLMTV
jgi:hypothetical protein